MTMTQEREADTPPDDFDRSEGFDFHRAELGAITGRGAAKRQVHYAYRVLGQPDRAELEDFLKAHLSVPPGRSTVYAELARLRDENGHPDTGTLSKLTDETIAWLDAEQAASKPKSESESESKPESEFEFERVQSSPASNVDSDLDLDTVDGGPSDLDIVDNPSPTNPDAGLATAEPVSESKSELEGEVSVVTVPLTVVQDGPSPAMRLVDGPNTNVDAAPVQVRVQAESDQPLDAAPAPDQEGQKLSPWVVGGCYLVALATLPVSLNTSWRFFEQVMHITSRAELFGMAAVMEIALVMCGVGMAHSVSKFGAPGPFRLVVWGICIFSGWTAWHMSDTLGESLARMVLGPVLGAVMLHLALGLIKRAHHHGTGVVGIIGREMRERLLSRLGVDNADRPAVQRTRDRATTRAVELSLPPRWRLSRKARLRRALLVAGVADDPAARERFLARRQVVHHTDELVKLDQGSPWT